MLDAGRGAGLTVAAEGFADRAYEAGRIADVRDRSRGPSSHDVDAVVARAVTHGARQEGPGAETARRFRSRSTPSASTATPRARTGWRRAARRSRAAPASTSRPRRCAAAKVGARSDMRWWREGRRRRARRSSPAGLGWMLDAFDVTLFAMALPAIRAELGPVGTQAGALGSVTLLGAAAGGVFFGLVADRFGRTRALIFSVALYSIFTAACGFATTLDAAGRVPHRSSASAWEGSGRAAPRSSPKPGRRNIVARRSASCRAAGRSATPPPRSSTPSCSLLSGWRAVFFVGILPAFFTLWVRRNVEEPPIWKARADRREARRAWRSPSAVRCSGSRSRSRS